MIDDREVRMQALHVACDAFADAAAGLERAWARYDAIMLAPHTFPADDLVDALDQLRVWRRAVDEWYAVVMFGAGELARGFVDAGAGV